MNAPDRKMLDLVPPQFLRRQQPASYAWWSDRSLTIVKGEETMHLSIDDILGLKRFFDQFDLEARP